MMTGLDAASILRKTARSRSSSAGSLSKSAISAPAQNIAPAPAMTRALMEGLARASETAPPKTPPTPARADSALTGGFATLMTATRSALSTWTNMTCPSPSGEARRPLFQKRCHTLAVIGSASRIPLKNALAVELGPEACFECVPAHLADCRQRLRGSGGEFVRQGE